MKNQLLLKEEHNQEDLSPDVISRWFLQSLHQVLERIILALPLRSILACRTVSKEWQNIVRYYHQSQVPRLLRMQEIRIHEEWIRKKPFVQPLQPSIEVQDVSGFDLVGDENNIFFAYRESAIFSPVKIIIFDSMTSTQTHTLDVSEQLKQSDLKHFDAIFTMRLGINEKYLVATAVIFTRSREINVLLTTLVWNRRDNFAVKPQIFQRVKPGRPLEIPFHPHLERSPYLKPIFYQDVLCLPIALNDFTQSQKIFYSCWNMSNGEFMKIIEKEYGKESVPFPGIDSFEDIDIFLCIRTDRILVLSWEPFWSRTSHRRISLYSLNTEEPIWELSSREFSSKQLNPTLIGFDETYVAITWLTWNVLHVHHWSDGRLKMTFQWGTFGDWVSIL